MKRFCLLSLMLGVALLAQAADPVPIYEREPPTDPEELKKYYAELEQALKAAEDAPKIESAKNLAAALAPKAARVRSVEVEIPARNDALIKIASGRKLTEQTITADVAGLVKQLRAGLDEESIDDADEILESFGGQPVALANAAAIAWVQEAPGTALLLAAETAQRAPGNANALNTLGALLADAGYVERGIPILAYLATKFPNDPTLQNNLGQAWLGAGAPELAKPRLLACLARAPGHGAANAGMGVIAYCAGDHAAAAKHFQAAAASNSSPLSRRALDRLDAPYTIPRSFRRVAPVQEFFNPRHFVPPVGQESLGEAETKKAEVAAFIGLVNERMKTAEAALTESATRLGREIGTTPNLAFGLSIAPAAGVSQLDLKHIASAYEGQVKRALEFQRDVDAFLTEAKELWKIAEDEVASIRAEFQKRWSVAAANKEIGEGGPQNEAFIAESKELCDRCRTVMQNALPRISRRYNELVNTVSTRERVAINEELTYLPLLFGGDLYRQQFYALVISHLQRIAMLAQVNPILTYECGPPLIAGAASPAVGDLPSPGPCPIKLKVNVGVGKFNADCTSIGFEFEAGLKFSAKKNFNSGETTLAGGVGVGADLGSVGQVEGGGQFVVVWDRGNSLSFVGVESSASAAISGIPGLSGAIDTGEGTSIGGSLPTGTSDLVNVSSETRLGVTLGPRGVEPTLSGSAGAEVLGQNLVKTEL